MNKKVVLIFDDDADILEVCSIILEQEGYLVHTETNCMQLLEKIGLANPSVILMDNQIMPDGGIVATQQIKHAPLFEQIPVVYFSANQRVQQLAAEAGAEYYLEKPFDVDELSALVTKAIG